ncbi:hypothetical protein GJ496_002055 [Pomphorhynchus laevis]|nr:hypothetical protein GJ496_002055 [Pomphorhynchus laevis]
MHRISYLSYKDLANPNENSLKILSSSDTSTVDPWQETGLVRSNGTINWACPCLGSAMAGPCAEYFRDAFTCFQKSSAESKGAECLKEFGKLTRCMKKTNS